MHNITPHVTTGTAPSELISNRMIRDKIPSVQDVVVEFSDLVEKENDCSQKQREKVAPDKKSGGKGAMWEIRC